jgi:hypothetical protein
VERMVLSMAAHPLIDSQQISMWFDMFPSYPNQKTELNLLFI